MENRDTIDIGDFNEGGAEPDCLYPTQVSKSEIDVSSLGVKLSNEPENCSRGMARQGMISETQSRSGIFEEYNLVVKLSVKKMKKEELRKSDKGAVNQLRHLINVKAFDRRDAGNQDCQQAHGWHFDKGDAGLQDIHQADVRFDKGDAGLQDIHQYRTRFDRGDAVIQDICQNLARFDIGDAGLQDIHQADVRTFYSAYLSLLEDMHQIQKKQIESLEDLDRQNTTFCGVPVFERISLPIPASLPRNKTRGCPETITDPQEQNNKPNNQEPVLEVNTGKKRRYGKFKGIQPVEIEEVPVNLPSGPSVPLLIGIPATDVVSVGRGSHAEEASQNGTKWRNSDICCCPIM